jgi:hypothetical protein
MGPREQVTGTAIQGLSPVTIKKFESQKIFTEVVSYIVWAFRHVLGHLTDKTNKMISRYVFNKTLGQIS